MSDPAKSSPSVHQHKSQADKRGVIRCAVVTVSDSRTPETDISGQYLCEKITAESHQVIGYHIVKDEPKDISEILARLTESVMDAVIFNGGTGISGRDRTYDVIESRLDKRLPGFGELFRMLSYQDIGTAAMLSRACAGVYQNTVIISIPGSPNAVKLAWTKLIAPELKHMVWEILR